MANKSYYTLWLLFFIVMSIPYSIAVYQAGENVKQYDKNVFMAGIHKEMIR